MIYPFMLIIDGLFNQLLNSQVLYHRYMFILIFDLCLCQFTVNYFSFMLQYNVGIISCCQSHCEIILSLFTVEIQNSFDIFKEKNLAQVFIDFTKYMWQFGNVWYLCNQFCFRIHNIFMFLVLFYVYQYYFVLFIIMYHLPRLLPCFICTYNRTILETFCFYYTKGCRVKDMKDILFIPVSTRGLRKNQTTHLCLHQNVILLIILQWFIGFLRKYFIFFSAAVISFLKI